MTAWSSAAYKMPINDLLVWTAYSFVGYPINLVNPSIPKIFFLGASMSAKDAIMSAEDTTRSATDATKDATITTKDATMSAKDAF